MEKNIIGFIYLGKTSLDRVYKDFLESEVGYSDFFTVSSCNLSNLHLTSGKTYVIWMQNHKTLMLQLFLKLLRKKIYIVVHNPQDFKQTTNLFKNILFSLIEKISALTCDKLCFISEAVFKGYNKENKILISKTLPWIPYKKKIFLNRKFDLIFIGRNLDYKGLDILYCSLLNIKNNKLNIAIVGQGVGIYSWDLLSQNITVIDEYVSSESYNNYLLNSKYCVLPYREVSQSGPLNDALRAQCGIICSDLDYFRIYNYSGNIRYFKSSDSVDLSILIEKLNFDIWTPTLNYPVSSWEDLFKKLRNFN